MPNPERQRRRNGPAAVGGVLVRHRSGGTYTYGTRTVTGSTSFRDPGAAKGPLRDAASGRQFSPNLEESRMPTRKAIEVVGDKPCVTAEADATVRQVAHLMKDHHTSAVLVIEQGRLVGICTERDLVMNVIAADRDPARTKVGTIMTRNPQTLAPDKPFGHALHLMFEGGFRHVPVVDAAGRPLGLLAARDALGLEALQLDAELVRREEITVIL